jgi:hypothetical protein
MYAGVRRDWLSGDGVESEANKMISPYLFMIDPVVMAHADAISRCGFSVVFSRDNGVSTLKVSRSATIPKRRLPKPPHFRMWTYRRKRGI